jgi:hypothetical protein
MHIHRNKNDLPPEINKKSPVHESENPPRIPDKNKNKE